MKKKIFNITLIVLPLSLVVLVLIGQLGGLATKEGEVKNINLGGVNDIVFTFEGDPRGYYINRGAERGLSVEELLKQLQNKTINITFNDPQFWNILDPKGLSRHITAVRYADQILYKE